MLNLLCAQSRIRSQKLSALSTLCCFAFFSCLFASPATAQRSQLLQRFTPSDSEPGDFFGSLVDLDGEVAIVRSRATSVSNPTSDLPPRPQTHVFEPDERGRWSETGLITVPASLDSPPPFTTGIFIGQETALDNGIIVNGQTFGGNIGTVQAVTFGERTTTGWESSLIRFDSDERRRISSQYISSGNSIDSAVGRSVGISGDIAIAGDAFGRSRQDQAASGVAHIYERETDGSWVWKELIQPENPDEAGVGFGFSVAIDGHTAVVSNSPFKDGFGDGRLFFYDRNDAGEWVQTDLLELDSSEFSADVENQIRSGFYHATISGDVAAAGLFGGVTAIFTRTGPLNTLGKKTWEQSVVFFDGSNRNARNNFAVDGDLLAVVSSNPNLSVSGVEWQIDSRFFPRVVNVYRRTADDTWDLIDTIASPDPLLNSTFGSSLAIDDGRLLVGAESAQLFNNVGDRIEVPGTAFLFNIVPEPASVQLLMIGLVLLSLRSRQVVG